MKRTFNKPATTYQQQVEQLRVRGMEIIDPAEAAFYLQHLNYYRLSAYWLPFEADHSKHLFKDGTTFAGVLNLYVFDRELRLLVLDAIERIEVSVRSQWAYQMAHLHGPHAHLDRSLTNHADRWQQHIDQLKEEVKRSDEAFIQHLTLTYSEDLPPVWAVCEVMSLGLFSKIYANLAPMATRKAIANVYGIDQLLLQSWLRHLTGIRNTCAHHSRLWNREFVITPKHPRSKPTSLANAWVPESRKIYNTLLILLYFMDKIAPRHAWRDRLKDLLSHHQIPVQSMGFPGDWEREIMWMAPVAP